VYLDAFELTRPTSVEAAVADLAEADGDASVYMGGTELLLLMKLGLSSPERLVDCKRIPELRGLREEGGILHIGAGTTHAELEQSDLVREFLPELAALESKIANRRIRVAGTLGGNLCFADPNSDPMTLLTALGASVEVAGPDGRRRIDILDFARAPYDSALEPDDLMVSLEVTLPGADARVAYERIVLRERPVVSVAVVRTADQDIKVAVGGAGQVARRQSELESLLSTGGAGVIEECVEQLAATLRPSEDLDGSPAYKTHLAGVLLRRAVARVLE
jgi:carbon-monoxide dehydrogenase medium subunit